MPMKFRITRKYKTPIFSEYPEEKSIVFVLERVWDNDARPEVLGVFDSKADAEDFAADYAGTFLTYEFDR